MERYFRFILKVPKTAIVMLVGLTLCFAYGITKLEFDNSIEAFLPQHDLEYRIYNQTKKIFGDSGRFIIMLISPENLWSRPAFELFDDLIQDLEEYQTYNEVLESDRINKLQALTAQKGLTVSQLLDAFSNDAVFTRALKRNLGKPTPPDVVLSADALRQLLGAAMRDRDFKKQGLIDELISPFTVTDISGENDTLHTYDLLSKDESGRRKLPVSEHEFEVFRRRLLRNPAFENAIFVQDAAGQKITDFGLLITFINMVDQDPIARHLRRLIQSYDQLNIVMQGIPVTNIIFNDYMQRDITRFLPFVMLVVVCVFFLNFRSLRGVILPFSTLFMAVVWVMGAMGYLGAKITAIGISLPPLMIAIGSSYAIHILNQYYADFDLITRDGLHKGVVFSMSHISSTVLLAGLTTAVSFITLCTSQASAVREWGVFSCLGVIFSVFISSTLIPAGIALLPHQMPALLLKQKSGKTAIKETFIDRILTAAIACVVRHAKAVLVVVSIIIVISAVGLLQLKIESDFLQYFKDDDTVRTSATLIEQKLGGHWGFNILIDSGRAGGAKDAKFLQMEESIRAWLTAEENRNLNIGRTDTFTDYIKTMHLAMHNDDPAYYAIPADNEDIMDYLEIYDGADQNSDGRIDDFEAYVDSAYRTINIIARFKEMEGYPIGTSEVRRIIQAVDTHLRQTLPRPYTHKITGYPIMDIKMADYIVSGQLQSLLLSLVFIALIVMLLFRKFTAGLLALIPMSLAVIVCFGIMGWCRISLDIVTSIIAAITIGIGVDDTIHVLNTYRYYHQQGYAMDGIIERVLRISGKAIIYTSLALIAGFSVLTISSFKPVILFGILMAITMAVTTIGALLVLPTVIRLTQVDLSPSRSGLWAWMRLIWQFKNFTP